MAAMAAMPEIIGTTRVYAILADPIHQVKTPQRINALLRARSQDGVMVPLHVGAASLAATAQALRGLRNFAGCVVTVPHKTAMAALCDELTPQAALAGAVNVVHRDAAGRLVGTLLDGEGFVVGLRHEGIAPRGLRAYVAGAGGAASAIAFALAAAGVSALCIANRTADKAAQLVERVARAYPALAVAVGDADASGHDLVVNATSLGLRADDPLPLDASHLKATQTVAEIVMEPAETPLLRAARERGCRVQYGAPMLECQVELMLAFMDNGPQEGKETAR